ncbi:MAG: hypothetical protein BJ554DRAFT_1438, partial [Olpidium bornovanus]
DFDLRIDETDLLLQIRPLREHEAEVAAASLFLYPETPSKRRKSAVEVHPPQARATSANARSDRRFSVTGNVPSNNVSAGGRVLFDFPPLEGKAAMNLWATSKAMIAAPIAIPTSDWYPTPCCSVDIVYSADDLLDAASINFEEIGRHLEVPLPDNFRPLQPEILPVHDTRGIYQTQAIAITARAQMRIPRILRVRLPQEKRWCTAPGMGPGALHILTVSLTESRGRPSIAFFFPLPSFIPRRDS